mgnify:FL=1
MWASEPYPLQKHPILNRLNVDQMLSASSACVQQQIQRAAASSAVCSDFTGVELASVFFLSMDVHRQPAVAAVASHVLFTCSFETFTVCPPFLRLWKLYALSFMGIWPLLQAYKPCLYCVWFCRPLPIAQTSRMTSRFECGKLAGESHDCCVFSSLYSLFE